jgi:hypothetical protein
MINLRRDALQLRPLLRRNNTRAVHSSAVCANAFPATAHAITPRAGTLVCTNFVMKSPAGVVFAPSLASCLIRGDQPALPTMMVEDLRCSR